MLTTNLVVDNYYYEQQLLVADHKYLEEHLEDIQDLGLVEDTDPDYILDLEEDMHWDIVLVDNLFEDIGVVLVHLAFEVQVVA